MQFLVICKDGTDIDAMDRRMAARPAHFERMHIEKEKGTFIMGGAILDEHDQMVGSSLYVNMEDRESLDKWLADDPYTKGNVWQTFEVHVMKIADI
ncbi:YciI family protein [Terasakiella sp. A23]|uniref:YciI family protein n=1 Tax=Terasakiella sp. FCG-A23 TaxID=3080561 RepID=UPI0029553999|nr:YciI family protein [Terasakiella sp. A23]MDV7338318.1 YciI family protein [Terasakiella sp. A23]